MNAPEELWQSLDWGDVVFAYGHLFAAPTKLSGVEAPMHDGRLDRERLVQMILTADFVGLERAGALALSLSTSKMLFIGTESVLVKKLKDVGAGPVSRAILAQITGDPEKDNARNIVYRLLGSDSPDPYGVVANWSQRSLLKNGYHHGDGGGLAPATPDRERLASLEHPARQIESTLQDEESKQPAVYKRLKLDVLDALRARVAEERSDD